MAWVVSAFSAGTLELLRRSRERVRGLLATPSPRPRPRPRTRARSLRFYASRETEGDEGEGKGCLSQRRESFMGDYGTPRCGGVGERDFIPSLSEGNKCRGTFDQPTPHAAPASPTLADATGDSDSEICISEPRDDRRALLPNNVAERTAAGS